MARRLARRELTFLRAQLALEGRHARDRLRMTFELFELGVEMMEANLRRRHPGATPEEIEQLLEAWLAERPGAEPGDGPGVPEPLTGCSPRGGMPGSASPEGRASSAG